MKAECENCECEEGCDKQEKPDNAHICDNLRPEDKTNHEPFTGIIGE